jgi:hypothetical protein
MKSSILKRLFCCAAAIAALWSFLPTVQAADYQTTVLSLGPAAYYPLNEASGATTALDISGNGHDGAVQSDATSGAAGPPVATFPGFGSNNTAYSFDGTASLRARKNRQPRSSDGRQRQC